jgi:hypothetical protein
MGFVPISCHHQSSLLSPGCNDDDDGAHNTLPTRGHRISIARSASARPLTNNGGVGIVLRRASSGDRQGAELDNARRILKRCQTAPGYVSFDDVLDEAFGRKGRSKSAQLLAQMQAGGSAYEPPRRKRCRSPDPLGTRRGRFMHRLVVEYLSPCLDFLGSVVFPAGGSAS